jgi:hypothetical protein
MTFNNLITLLFVVGMGYMMFRGGGCCGGHGKHKGDGKKTDEKTIEAIRETAGADPDNQDSANR